MERAQKEKDDKRDDNNANGAQWVETKLRPTKSAWCGSTGCIVEIDSRNYHSISLEMPLKRRLPSSC